MHMKPAIQALAELVQQAAGDACDLGVCDCSLRSLGLVRAHLMCHTAVANLSDVLACRDHSVPDSLDYVAAYNAAMLPSADIQEGFAAVVKERRKPVFAKL